MNCMAPYFRRRMRRRRAWGCILVALVFALPAAAAEVTLGAPFRDNMVLQQGVPVPVWGTAEGGSKITVRFAGQEVAATADPEGGSRARWSVEFAPLKTSSKPADLTVSVGEKTLTVRDVLVGEVWLCSGQSNMQWPVKKSLNAEAEMKSATYPSIRMLTSGRKQWAVCSPETVGDFSAVGYFFARDLHKALHVPVGILNASQGGTQIQPWMTPESARAIPSLADYWKHVDALVERYKADPKKYKADWEAEKGRILEARNAWEAELFANDPGVLAKWYAPETKTEDWIPIDLPMAGADGSLNTVGTVWLRHTATIPDAWVGKKLVLHIGPIDEIDTTYVNGHRVGHTGRETKDFWKVPRQYPVPAKIVTSTKVTIAIQMYNLIGMMGLFGTPGQMALRLADDPNAPPVSLATTWHMQEGVVTRRCKEPSSPLPARPSSSGDYGGLFRHHIQPLVPYAIRGVLWYQGESNANEPIFYRTLAPALVTGWRAVWQRELPFCYVQLAGHQGRQRLPVERYTWADLRDSQGAALALPETGMVVATDIGDGADIHPRNKQEVGKRLALWALATQYGKPVEYSGPRLVSMDVRDGQAILTLDHADGLRLEGADKPGFAIAGKDKVFHSARAEIRDGKLVVTAIEPERVPEPVAVRYGWGGHPACFLYNEAGLPASPFRTDDWSPEEIRVGR